MKCLSLKFLVMSTKLCSRILPKRKLKNFNNLFYPALGYSGNEMRICLGFFGFFFFFLNVVKTSRGVDHSVSAIMEEIQAVC